MWLSTGFFALWFVVLTVGQNYEPKVVCYYQGWAVTRVGYAYFEPSDIDITLCTHLIYAYGDSTRNGDVKLLYPKNDLPDDGGLDGFRKFNALRKQNGKLKTLLSISNNLELFYNAGTDTALRSTYVKNLVEFVLRHEFDGLDIYWKLVGISDDIPNYVVLIKELREKLDEHDLLLSINAAGPEIHARWYFDIAGIAKYVDFVALDIECTYAGSPTTAHIAPLYPGLRTTSSVELIYNVNASVNYWLNQGLPAEKLILGIRLWGRKFILKNPVEHSPGSPTISPVVESSNIGRIAYNEICRLMSQPTWNSVWDEQQHASYSYGGNQWITYDSVSSAIEKGKYAKALGLGGVMVWSIDGDDHRGDCGRRYPILNALNCGIREIGCNSVSTPVVTSTPSHIPHRTMCGSTMPSVDVKIVCDYHSGAITAGGYKGLAPSEIDPTLCTHMIYSFVGVTDDGDVKNVNPQIDLKENGGSGAFEKVNALRKRNEKLKTLLGSRSWVQDSTQYSNIVANTSLRKKYVKNVVDFVLRHEFDGFQVNWYSSGNDGHVPDYSGNYLLLLKELSDSFHEHKLILSILLDGTQPKSYSDIPQISRYVDFIALFSVYRQGSERTTGHLEPLYPPSSETSSYDLTRNVNASIHSWLNEGAPAEKLILSTWFFGISYALDNFVDNSRGSPARVFNAPNSNSPSINYNQICRLLLQDDTWVSVWDEEQRVPYIHAGNRWISYDDARSLIEKAHYVKAMGLGGIVAHNIDQDDHRGDCGERFPLLKALTCGLRDINCTSVPEPKYSSQTETGLGGTFARNPIADKIASEVARRSCAKLNTKYVRHPQDCARFWICQKIRENEIKAEPFSCATGLYFDTSKVICRTKTLVQCN